MSSIPGAMHQQRTSSAAARRVPYWDNAKWLAMALVVIGHGVQPLALDSDVALVPYLVIYAFHMPFFGLISGYFTTADPGSRQYRRVINDLLVPYAIFEFIWSVIESIRTGTTDIDFAVPEWTLWFLLALAFFRIALPVIARLRYPLLWVTVLALLVGYWEDVDQTFSLMRAVEMLPYFTAGWELRRWRDRDGLGFTDRVMQAKHLVRWRLAAVAIVLAAGTVAWLWSDLWREMQLRHWLFLDRAFADLSEDVGPSPLLIRLAVMAITVTLLIAALALVPRRRTWFTSWGAATMTIYLLHTFVLYWPRESDWLRGFAPHWYATPLTIFACLALVVLLSQPGVRHATRWLTEPRASWLLRKPNAPATGTQHVQPSSKA